MKLKPFLSILFCLVLFQCRSDQLFDEREVLIGTWNYSHTYDFTTCAPTGLDTLYSSDITGDPSIEISKKEKIYLLNDGESTSKLDIGVSFFEESDQLTNGYSISLFFNDEPANIIEGFVNQDTLWLNGLWPSQYVDAQCHKYSNIFVK